MSLTPGVWASTSRVLGLALLITLSTGFRPVAAQQMEPGELLLTPYGELVADQDALYDRLGLTVSYNTRIFDFFFDMSLVNDDKYVPEEPYMFGHYFDLRQGTIGIDVQPFSLLFGRAIHRDEVPTPYSLFISSWDIPAAILNFRYEDRFFFYESRWIGLNRNSKWYRTPQQVYEWDLDPGASPDIFDPDDLTPVPDTVIFNPLDRGANYKVWGIRLGDWRVGFQESVVYLNDYFYAEYFMSPLPMYFTQLVNSTTGKPWTRIDDENSHMGFFVDVTRPDRYGYVQFIMGDINLDFLVPGEELGFVNKWAWSIGGTRDFSFGRLGLYHAGALKYTFAATTARANRFSTKRYEYTYFPAIEFIFEDGRRAIDYRDNYIGYKYGENNLAFMVTLDRSLERIDVSASAEYVVSGSKSPANPWHEHRGTPSRRNVDGRFFLLNENPLEHTIRLGTTIDRTIGPWDLRAGAMIGAVFNELRVVPGSELDRADEFEDGEIQPGIYKPSDSNRLLFEFLLGARYRFGVRPRS